MLRKKKRGCYSGAPLLSTYVILHVTALFGQNTTLHTLYLHSTYTHETSLSNFQISHTSKRIKLKICMLTLFNSLNKITQTKKPQTNKNHRKIKFCYDPKNARRARPLFPPLSLERKKEPRELRRRTLIFSTLPQR